MPRNPPPHRNKGPPSASGTGTHPQQERIHAGRPPDPYSPSVFHIRQQAVFPPFPTGWHGLCLRRLSTPPGSASSVSSSNPLGLCMTFSSNESACPASYRTMDAINCARRFPCGVSPKRAYRLPYAYCGEGREPHGYGGGKCGEKSGDVSGETCDSRLAAAMPSPDQVFQLVRPVGIPGAKPVPIPQAGDPALPVRRRGRSAP